MTVAKPTLQRLKGMIGRSFLYKGSQITILDYHVLGEEGKTQIDIEDGEPIKVNDLLKFVDACLPVQEEPNGAISVQAVQQTDSLLSTLQATLLDNINQVKKNKDYIKQANVINSSVNALIGMAKLQIQVEKMKK